MSEEIKSKILSKGNWRVIIRPSKFEKEKLELENLLPTITKCSVSLRGWDYPHIHVGGPFGEVMYGSDFIETNTDFRNHREIWKYFQSGLFGHRFSFPEDGNSDSTKFWILGNLYKITEIYQFVSNLASRDVLGENLKVSVDLYNTKNRYLTFGDPVRDVDFGSYQCREDKLSFSDDFSKVDVIATAPEIALRRAKWIFQRFGWVSVDQDLLRSHQEPFLRGQFRF
jgi:hypothetical protein